MDARMIREYLKDYILLTDGAMGTYFDETVQGEYLCSEEANLFAPERISEIHRAYIDAGASLIRSNTFAANRRTWEAVRSKYGMQWAGGSFSDFVQAGYTIARMAVEEAAERGRVVFAAADIGPVYEESESEKPEIHRQYYEIADIFLAAGADIFVLETFPDEKDVLALAKYIRDRCPGAFIIGQFSFVPTGYGRTGAHYRTVLSRAADSGLLDGVGLNCGIGAAHMEKFLRDWLTIYHMPEQVALTALPNCGYPQIVRGHAVYSDSVPYFGAKAADLAALGVRILGGCCGTSPAYIKEIADHLSSGRGQKGRKEPVRIDPAVKRAGIYQTVSVEQRQESHVGERQKSHVGQRQESHVGGRQKSRETGSVNRFREKMERGEMVCAVELDPPFDSGAEKLMAGAGQLAGTRADVITIADSPLARSRADSLLTAVMVERETGMAAMPHLTCRDRNRIAIRSGLLGAYLNGIRNALIVTGDPVGRDERAFTKSVFDFNSIKLMEFMRTLNEELFASEPVFYGGALNQNGARADKIAERMKRKMDAGCSFFLTQPVYSEEEIERLSWLQAQTGARILIGIMPLVSYRNALFMKNEMPGIYVPDEVVGRYAPEGTREQWEETAEEISAKVIAMGKDVGAGYYFMTPFHRVSLIRRIMDRGFER